MNRKVSGPRKAYVKTFNEWMEKNGAKIEGVEIAEFGNQGLNKVPNNYSETRLYRTARDRPNPFVITGSIYVLIGLLGPKYLFVITECSL